MDYWTSHHFSGKRDDKGKFKGKGELQFMQVQQNGDNGGFIENLRQKFCKWKWEHEESESEAFLP